MEGNFLGILDNGHGIDTPKKSYKIVVLLQKLVCGTGFRDWFYPGGPSNGSTLINHIWTVWSNAHANDRNSHAKHRSLYTIQRGSHEKFFDVSTLPRHWCNLTTCPSSENRNLCTVVPSLSPMPWYSSTKDLYVSTVHLSSSTVDKCSSTAQASALNPFTSLLKTFPSLLDWPLLK